MEYFHRWFICSCIALCMATTIDSIHGRLHQSLVSKESKSQNQIVVDKSGSGKFTTIQSAIDSVTSNNTQWVVIYVKAGTYREKVIIPSDKPYIVLKGEGKESTQIVWDDTDNLTKSTFTSMADNFVARDISFANSYNGPGSTNSMKVAVAARILGDKSAFFGCGFSSKQDTLLDDRGRHYFKSCTIEGAVDFIFGAGQSIYEDCYIKILADGCITAQARDDPNSDSGFVFIGCNVFGNGKALLGRAWKGYARVLYYNSNFADVIQPEGWSPWQYKDHVNQLTFSEESCQGAGADTSKRMVEKKLDQATIEKLTSIDFIDNEGWVQKFSEGF